MIYGATLASYTFIQGLLASGVPGSRLVMIQPPTNLPSSFNNPELDEVVEKSLQNAGNHSPDVKHRRDNIDSASLYSSDVDETFISFFQGVTLYKDYTLARWNHKEESNLLKNATFTSSNKPLMLECQVNQTVYRIPGFLKELFYVLTTSIT